MNGEDLFRALSSREGLSERFRSDYGAYLDEPARAAVLEAEARYLLGALQGEGKRILDAGCGAGVQAALLAAGGAGSVVGLDPSPEKLNDARIVAGAAGLPPQSVEWVEGSAMELPFPDGAFGAVLFRESLSHVPSAQRALAEARRVLAPGGIVHVRDFNNAWNLFAALERRRFRRDAEEKGLSDIFGGEPPYRLLRRRMLADWFPGLAADRLEWVTSATRGYYGEALRRAAANALGTDRAPPPPEFRWRHPESGAAEERAFSPASLARLLKEAGFAPETIRPRHFHGEAPGLRGRLAAARSKSIPALYPASLLWCPVVEGRGTKPPAGSLARSAGSSGAVSAGRFSASAGSKNPPVTVVIPSLDGWRGGNVPRLAEAVLNQGYPNVTVETVIGVSPCGKAHNEGARRAAGEILVFLDDDVTLGDDRVVENLVRALQDHPEYGIVGASQLLPPDANGFQRWCASALPRTVFPVVDRMTESDMATHAAMAIRRELYEKIGGEPEDLSRADDQVLRARVRRAGFRIGVAPGTWVFHPPPASLRAFWRKRFRDGAAARHDERLRPDLIYDLPSADGAGGEPAVRGFSWRAARAAVRFAGDLLAGNLLAVASRLAHTAGRAAAAIGRGDPRAAAKAPDARRKRLVWVEYGKTRFYDLDRELLRERYDLIRFDYCDFFAGKLRWIRSLDRAIRGADGAVAWFGDFHAVLAGLLARLRGKPLVVIGGGYDVVRMRGIGYGIGTTAAGRLRAAAAFALSRRVVTSSLDSARALRENYRVPPGKISAVYQGVRTFDGATPALRFPREPIALTVGEITPLNLKRKGLEAFVRVAALAPEYRFVLAGRADPAALEALTASAPPNFEYAGFLSDADLAALYGRARLYLQLSLHEGFGLSLAEAMLYGCYPVATRAGAIPEVVGDCGAYAPRDDPAGTAAIVRALAPSARDHERASLRIRERFPMARRGEELERVLEETLRPEGAA